MKSKELRFMNGKIGMHNVQRGSRGGSMRLNVIMPREHSASKRMQLREFEYQVLESENRSGRVLRKNNR